MEIVPGGLTFAQLAAVHAGPVAATLHASAHEAIVASAGYSAKVTVDGQAVVVTVHAGVDYAFPSPGFPSGVTATATAVAVSGITGEEGG